MLKYEICILKTLNIINIEKLENAKNNSSEKLEDEYIKSIHGKYLT